MANHDYNHGNDHNNSVRSNIDKIKQVWSLVKTEGYADHNIDLGQ